MTTADARPPDQAMVRYVAARRPAPPANPARDLISDRYGRFYAPLAIGGVLLVFMRLFGDVDVTGNGWSRHSSYGSLVAMATDSGAGIAVIGLLLAAALVTLLSVAACRVRSAALPAGVVVLAGLIAWMLVTKPGTGTPTPALTDAGVAGLVLAIGIGMIGTAHAIHLTVIGWRTRPAHSTPEGE
jgi:hypothetical protein